MTYISSLQNPKVKEAVRLRDRRAREETSHFLIEGFRELTRAVDAGHAVEELFFCPDLFLGTNERALIAQAGCPATECSKSERSGTHDIHSFQKGPSPSPRGVLRGFMECLKERSHPFERSSMREREIFFKKAGILSLQGHDLCFLKKDLPFSHLPKAKGVAPQARERSGTHDIH